MSKPTSAKSKNALKLQEEGIRLRENGKLTEAIKTLTDSIEINPDDYISFHNIGICKQLQGKHKEALQYFNLAITLKPTETSIFLSRAESKLEVRDFKGAIEDYTEYLFLAKEKLDQGEAKQAFHDFSLLIETNRSYNEEAESTFLIKDNDPIYLQAYIGRGKAKKALSDQIGAILDWSYASELGNKEASQLLREEYLITNYDISTKDIENLKKQASKNLNDNQFKQAEVIYKKLLEYKRILNDKDKSLSEIYLASAIANNSSGKLYEAMIDWAIASELGNKEAFDILKRKRRGETKTQNELKLLSTKEKLFLSENPLEYKKWVESNYTYKISIK